MDGPMALAPVPADRAGIGLRHPHYLEVAEGRPPVGWLEVHSENYLGGGAWLNALERVRRDYPLALHGVGLSLGRSGPVDAAHLGRIRALVERIEPAIVSEHLSWSIVDGVFLNDLLPFPYTVETLANFCRNVAAVQDAIKRPILVENPSVYVGFHNNDMAEWEFLGEVVRRTGCLLLFDVNNLHVCSRNLGIDAARYLAALPAESVREIHLAGHTARRLDDGAELLIDDHGSPVPDPVWTLYAAAIRRFGRVPTLIERDNNIPELSELVAEAARADAVAASAMTAHAHAA